MLVHGTSASASVPAALDRGSLQVVADYTRVTDEAAVAELARRAVERFGRIDVWVNNAGVYLLGLLEATSPEAFRRVLETNFFGYVHGAPVRCCPASAPRATAC